MRKLVLIIFFIFFASKQVFGDEALNWLKTEIDVILNAYNNKEITAEVRFDMIENTINYNFAGAGIAKFVSGDSWLKSDKETKKAYIKSFKRHLALNIASMMQGYSEQNYNLINSKYDSNSKVSLIDMEILNDTGSVFITWRVKKSKDRYFIIDLLVANISLVVTKRSDFNSLLKDVNYKKKKFNELLKTQNEESFSKIVK